MPTLLAHQTVLGKRVLAGLARAGAVLGLLLAAAGCSLSRMAADTTAGFLAEAAPAARAYFDYESAGTSAAAGIVQLEGLHEISPDNERLSLTLAQAYVVYAFGWVMDEHEQALAAHDYERADHHRSRAYNMYKRALDLVRKVLYERDPELERLSIGDPERLARHLREEFDDREDDIELMFWWALTWGSTVTNSPSIDGLADLDHVKVVARHSMWLDETYEDGGAIAMLGGFDCAYPEQYGGDWKRGREQFERAIAISKRKNHVHLVNLARTCAVNAQDKPLFISLLREVVESGDQGDPNRLGNKVARRRAERYLARTSDWFD